MRSVYVAGTSLDIDRADRWIAALTDAGHKVTSTWPDVIRKVGDANPRDATRSQRMAWSWACLTQVRDCDVMWFLVPPTDRPTRGAWIELGYAAARGVVLVTSGDTKQSIFTADTFEFDEDHEAFAWICGMGTPPREVAL